MEYLAEHLPELITYISFGFIFIKPYEYVRVIKPISNQQGFFIECLTVGFVICKIFNAIPISINPTIDTIIMAVITFAVSYGVGRFVNSSWFEKLCDKLKMQQTPNDDIWRDIEDKDCGVYVVVKDLSKNIVINGLLVLYEQHSQTPYIQLSKYVIAKNGEKIEDHSNEPHYTILLDTSKYDMVSVVYDKTSKRVSNWK